MRLLLFFFCKREREREMIDFWVVKLGRSDDGDDDDGDDGDGDGDLGGSCR